MLSFIFGSVIGGVFGTLLTACFVRSGELSRQEEIHYSRFWRDEDEKDNC